MAAKPTNRAGALMCFFLIACIVLVSPCYAYDRDLAVAYALRWSEDTGAMDGIANETIYFKYVGSEYDCANFASQCVIDGEIRFRSSDDPETYGNDNIRKPILGECFPELGTGYDSRIIKSEDTKHYSRVLPAADQLPRSLMHPWHNDNLYKSSYTAPNDLIDSGGMWNDVAPGDLCFRWNESQYTHCMFINRVAKTSNPKDIFYCAHSKWRSDHSMNSEVPNWKTSGTIQVVCLWDAPIVKEFMISSGEDQLDWKWGRKWPSSYQVAAGKADLIFRVTFDTNMDVTGVPDIRLVVAGSEYTFERWPEGSGINNKGWWTSPDNGSFKQYRTWKGRILADNLPANKHAVGRISIYAFADDGSANDRNNELSDYRSDNMSLIKVRLDTRRTGEDKSKSR